MSLPVALVPGTMIGGQYVIGDLINSGGFGAVYRGADTSEGNRPCAIKETYNVTPAARRQALMEASVLFTVRSKHLPEVYDAFEANGRFYLVMQLIEGQNLLQLLQTRVPGGLVGEREPHQQLPGPCSESEVLGWLLPIVDVLQELHSRNPPIMHRDIKPGNVILTPQQTTVLVDFGLTKLYDPVETTRTMVKAVSEGFSPVEQYVGKTCPQSDIYAMAATMYLLLTNRLPPASLGRTMRDDLIAPRLLNPALSPKMERVLLKALAINASDRYQSMREFAEALREPAFTAYADQTIVALPVQVSPGSTPYAPTVAAPVPSMPMARTSGPAMPQVPSTKGPNPVPRPSSNGSGGSPHPANPQVPPVPSGANRHAPLPNSPNQPPKGRKGAGSRMAPPVQKSMSPAKLSRHLPNPANQGCLWGVVQGILGALVVLSSGDSGFFLSTLMALFFYTFAGFVTTRRGGGFFRGGRAGYHTCLVGTIFFWFSLGVGLVLKLGKELKVISASSDYLSQRSGEAIGVAWQNIQPSWPALSIVPDQPFLFNILVWAVGGITLAWLLGWVGGWLGTIRFQSKIAASKRQRPAY
jgi:serine/threonine protein kinase